MKHSIFIGVWCEESAYLLCVLARTVPILQGCFSARATRCWVSHADAQVASLDNLKALGTLMSITPVQVSVSEMSGRNARL
jgi:hypothetical protein